MYPLYEQRDRLRRRALRNILLELSHSNQDVPSEAVLRRVMQRCLGRVRKSLGQERESGRWGTAFDILRHRLQHDLDAIHCCRQEGDAAGGGNVTARHA